MKPNEFIDSKKANARNGQMPNAGAIAKVSTLLEVEKLLNSKGCRPIPSGFKEIDGCFKRVTFQSYWDSL